MVDLVKLRKKAKKQAAQAEPEQPAVASSQLPVAEERGAGSPTRPGGSEDPPHVEATGNHQPATPAENKLEKFKETAGQQRAGVVAQAATDSAPSEQVELLTFVIAGENYAVAIENIVEIVTPRPVTRIPNADDTIVGIISLRGTIVTLLDVRRKLRHPDASAAGAETRIVVLEHHGETVGFEVDRVLRVVKTGAGAIEPHPVVHSSELDDAIRGVFRQANALTILLDLDKLLGSRGHAATQETIAARR
jgi:purine-binding chemotaxis protein CheW